MALVGYGCGGSLAAKYIKWAYAHFGSRELKPAKPDCVDLPKMLLRRVQRLFSSSLQVITRLYYYDYYYSSTAVHFVILMCK